MLLPAFREDGWLPEGHHHANWADVVMAFRGAEGSQRETILNSLLTWHDAARAQGLGDLVILDGSFISSKAVPGDFDLLFFYDSVSEEIVKHNSEAWRLTDYQACHADRFLGDIFAFSQSLLRLAPQLCHGRL